MKNEYRVDPEISRARLEEQANQRYLNPSYPSNLGWEEETDPEEEEKKERCQKFVDALRENLQALRMLTLTGASIALLSQPHKEGKP